MFENLKNYLKNKKENNTGERKFYLKGDLVLFVKQLPNDKNTNMFLDDKSYVFVGYLSGGVENGS